MQRITIFKYNLNLAKTFLVKIRFQLFLKTVNGGCFFDVKRKFVPFCRGGKTISLAAFFSMTASLDGVRDDREL